MASSEADRRSADRRASDERIAGEPPLAPLDLPPDTSASPVVAHLK
jgi:hypothetical protein